MKKLAELISVRPWLKAVRRAFTKTQNSSTANAPTDSPDFDEGAVAAEVIVVVLAILLIGFVAISFFGSIMTSEKPDEETAVKHLIGEVIKIPDACSDITGKLYTIPTLQGIVDRNVNEAVASYYVNFPDLLPVMGVIYNCTRSPAIACTLLVERCSNGACTAANRTIMETEIEYYVEQLSSLGDFVSAAGGSNIQIQALMVLDDAGVGRKDALMINQCVSGGAMIIAAPSPSPIS